MSVRIDVYERNIPAREVYLQHNISFRDFDRCFRLPAPRRARDQCQPFGAPRRPHRIPKSPLLVNGAGVPASGPHGVDCWAIIAAQSHRSNVLSENGSLAYPLAPCIACQVNCIQISKALDTPSPTTRLQATCEWASFSR